MDLQTYIKSHMHDRRATEFAYSDQLSLGEIISKCEALVPDYADSPKVIFDLSTSIQHTWIAGEAFTQNWHLALAQKKPPTLNEFIET